MTIENIKIKIIIFYNKETKSVITNFCSNIAGANVPSELWCSEKTHSYAIYHQDMFYNDVLLNRRNNNNMIHPIKKDERMFFISNVYGAEIHKHSINDIVISCHEIELNDVSVDII